MEWDLPAGPTCRPMLILTPVSPIRYGHGGVVGEEAGAVAGVVALAGVGLHLTGTSVLGDGPDTEERHLMLGRGHLYPRSRR